MIDLKTKILKIDKFLIEVLSIDRTSTVRTVEDGDDLLLIKIDEPLTIKAKDDRFDIVWKELFLNVEKTDYAKQKWKGKWPIQVNKLTMEQVREDANLPPLSVMNSQFKEYEVKEQWDIPNDKIVGGFKKVWKRDYIHKRVIKELRPNFFVSPLKLVTYCDKFILAQITGETLDAYLQFKSIILEWMNNLGTIKTEDGVIYTSPARWSDGKIVSAGRDSHTWVRITVYINVVTNYVMFSDLIKTIPRLAKILFEVGGNMFVDPYGYAKKVKGWISQTTMNPRLMKIIKTFPDCYNPRFGNSQDHYHLCYPDTEKRTNRETYPTYTRAELCENCDMDHKMRLHKAMKSKAVTDSYADCEDEELLWLIQCVNSKVINYSVTNLLLYMHVISGMPGFKRGNIALTMRETAIKAAEHRAKMVLGKELTPENWNQRRLFQQHVRDLTYDLVKIAVREGWYLSAEAFKRNFPHMLTAKSSGLRGIRVSLNLKSGKRDVTLSSKQQYLLHLGNSIYNFTTSDIFTETLGDYKIRLRNEGIELEDGTDISRYSKDKNTSPMRMNKSGVRHVPARDSRLIFAVNVYAYLLQCAVYPYIDVSNNFATEEVVSPYPNTIDVGNSNYKLFLDATDDGLAPLVEATSHPKYMLRFVDQSQFDQSADHEIMGKMLFIGIKQALLDSNKEFQKPYFTIDGNPVSLIDAVDILSRIDACQTFLVEDQDEAIIHRSSHTPSGDKNTFDKNTQYNQANEMVHDTLIAPLKINKVDSLRIAGDDNISRFRHNEASVQEMKQFAEADEKLEPVTGFRMNKDKSGVAACTFEFAKKLGDVGSIISIGLMQLCTSEKETTATTPKEKVTGFASIANEMMIRYPADLDLATDFTIGLATLGFMVNTKDKKAEVEEGEVKKNLYITPSSGVVIMPTDFAGGCGVSFSGTSTNELVYLYNVMDTEWFGKYCALADKFKYKKTALVKDELANVMKDAVEKPQSSKLIIKDTGERGLARGKEVFTNEPRHLRASQAAVRKLGSLNYKIDDKLKLNNADDSYIKRTTDTFKLDATSLRVDASDQILSITNITKGEIFTAITKLLTLYPLLRTGRMQATVEKLNEVATLSRYPTAHTGLVNVFKYLGTRNESTLKSTRSSLATYTKVLNLARQQGSRYSADITAESLKELCDKAIFNAIRDKTMQMNEVITNIITSIFGELIGINPLVSDIIRSIKQSTPTYIPFSVTGSIAKLLPNDDKFYQRILTNTASMNRNVIYREMSVVLLAAMISMGHEPHRLQLVEINTNRLLFEALDKLKPLTDNLVLKPDSKPVYILHGQLNEK